MACEFYACGGLDLPSDPPEIDRECGRQALRDREPDQLDTGLVWHGGSECLPARSQFRPRLDRGEQHLVGTTQLVATREVVELPARMGADAAADPHLGPGPPVRLQAAESLPEQVRRARDRDLGQLEDPDRGRRIAQPRVDRLALVATGALQSDRGARAVTPERR